MFDQWSLMRFFSWVDRDPLSGCWLWTGYLNAKGYGQFRDDGNHYRAHRWALALQDEEMPPKEVLCLHACDTPRCVNPAHLRWGTHADNMTDAFTRGRYVDAHSKRCGRNNPAAKLTDEQVADIRSDLRSQSAIGLAYGISQSHVSALKRAIPRNGNEDARFTPQRRSKRSVKSPGKGASNIARGQSNAL